MLFTFIISFWSFLEVEGYREYTQQMSPALMKSGTEKIIEAYHWLQEHHNEFNKEVHGPVLLELCIL